VIVEVVDEGAGAVDPAAEHHDLPLGGLGFGEGCDVGLGHEDRLRDGVGCGAAAAASYLDQQGALLDERNGGGGGNRGDGWHGGLSLGRRSSAGEHE